MTEEEVCDYIANECGTNPYFVSYDDNEINVIHIMDDNGNRFEVKVTKED